MKSVRPNWKRNVGNKWKRDCNSHSIELSTLIVVALGDEIREGKRLEKLMFSTALMASSRKFQKHHQNNRPIKKYIIIRMSEARVNPFTRSSYAILFLVCCNKQIELNCEINDPSLLHDRNRVVVNRGLRQCESRTTKKIWKHIRIAFAN